MSMRNKWSPVCTVVCSMALALWANVCGRAATAQTSQGLTAQINPMGKLSVPGSVTLTTSGTTFLAYTGSLIASYKMRTTPGGSGSMTVQASADFTPAGGPTVSTGQLTYTCAAATLGTSCSGMQTISTTTQTPVVNAGAGICTGGGAPCSASNPNSVQMNFSLTNSPAFKTGTYSITLTFNVSAL